MDEVVREREKDGKEEKKPIKNLQHILHGSTLRISSIIVCDTQAPTVFVVTLSVTIKLEYHVTYLGIGKREERAIGFDSLDGFRYSMLFRENNIFS
jgi:hypothetical protein